MLKKTKLKNFLTDVVKVKVYDDDEVMNVEYLIDEGCMQLGSSKLRDVFKELSNPAVFNTQYLFILMLPGEPIANWKGADVFLATIGKDDPELKQRTLSDYDVEYRYIGSRYFTPDILDDGKKLGDFIIDTYLVSKLDPLPIPTYLSTGSPITTDITHTLTRIEFDKHGRIAE